MTPLSASCNWLMARPRLALNMSKVRSNCNAYMSVENARGWELGRDWWRKRRWRRIKWESRISGWPLGSKEEEEEEETINARQRKLSNASCASRASLVGGLGFRCLYGRLASFALLAIGVGIDHCPSQQLWDTPGVLWEPPEWAGSLGGMSWSAEGCSLITQGAVMWTPHKSGRACKRKFKVACRIMLNLYTIS